MHLYLAKNLGFYVFAVQEREKIKYVDKSPVTTKVDTLQLYEGVAVMSVSILTNIVQQNNIILFMKDMCLFDKKMSQLDLEVDFKSAHKSISSLYINF